MLENPLVGLFLGAVIVVVAGLVLRRWQDGWVNSKAFLWTLEVVFVAGFITIAISVVVDGEIAWYDVSGLLAFGAAAVHLAFRLGSSGSGDNHVGS